ncbi:MAG: hypothetical protein QOF61_2484 [Acidobacteriota bacterium]|jgi:hypothetical protein|nr:hypothetical protein [Acidobacteriota bacterium]
MKSLRAVFLTFIGFSLVTAVGYGGYFAAPRVARTFSAFELRPVGAGVLASLAVLLAAIIAASSIHQSGRARKAGTLHAEKIATYQFYTDLWVPLLRLERAPADRGPYPWPAERQALDRLISLYGSPGVVKAYAAFCAAAGESVANTLPARSQFVKALLEMRKDLGSETWGLTAEELLQLFFANPEQGAAHVEASRQQDGQAAAPPPRYYPAPVHLLRSEIPE